VADGQAHYYVVSLSPLVLQHIDIGDGWQLPDAHLRGLRKSDIINYIESTKALEELI
jgi:hypothetical protein